MGKGSRELPRYLSNKYEQEHGVGGVKKKKGRKKTLNSDTEKQEPEDGVFADAAQKDHIGYHIIVNRGLQLGILCSMCF